MNAIAQAVHNTPFGDIVDTEDDLQPLVARPSAMRRAPWRCWRRRWPARSSMWRTCADAIWANGSSANGYLGEDAADGTTYLYGPWSFAWQDLGVSHWKYFGTSGAYSDHVRTAVYSSTGAALPTVSVNGETGYRVNKGQVVQVEFTYENNGRDTQTVNTGWYVSTNDIISRTDRLIASNTGMVLSRGDVMTYRRTVRSLRIWRAARTTGSARSSTRTTSFPTACRATTRPTSRSG